MPHRFLPFAGLFPLLLLWHPTLAQTQPGGRPAYRSPLGLAVNHDGTRAYVALHTAAAVAVVDLQAGKVLREIAVDPGPCDVTLAGNVAFVACEHGDTLVRLDLAKHAVTGRWAVGQAPRGVAALPDGSRAFVACHDEQTLHALDVADGGKHVLPLPGRPERVLLHRDAGYPFLLVLSALPGEARVSLVDPKLPPRLLHSNRLPDAANARGLASKQGTSSYILVAHQKARAKVPATQVAQGWVFTNAISSFSPWGVDTQTDSSRASMLDDPRGAYADPSDVVLLPDHRHAFVACAGADTVLVLRTDRFVNANYGPLDAGADHPRGRDDLAQSRRYVIARLPTQANPRRLALSGDGKTLVVSNHLADSLTVIDTQEQRVLQHIALGDVRPDAVRRGEILFHSGKMTFQGQFTCASCHPGGGSDGLTWDLSRDGLGNFLNTRSLRGVADTAPYGWLGTSPTLADRVAGTLRTLHRHEPEDGELSDLTAYLKTLTLPRPLPRKGGDAAVARGKALFEGKGKCASCHHGPALDDAIAHDVGTKVTGDPTDRFDAPSLRGLAHTPPYLHHGQAATLEEVFTRHNPRQRHGAAHLLTGAELADLIAYLRSL
jgi:DNA-binding beta-propeller fold protein YncE